MTKFEDFWEKHYASKGYAYGDDALSLVKMGWEMHRDHIVGSWELSSEETGLLHNFTSFDDEPPKITLCLCRVYDEDDTHEYGLAAFYTEYPEEGSLMIKRLPEC